MKRILDKLDKHSNSGAALIIEATVVFPIAFLVVFFVMCLGNSNYTIAYMDRIAAENAVLAANYARNETTLTTEIEGYTAKKNLNPYQIFGASESLLYKLNYKVNEEASSSKNSFIGSMKPTQIVDADGNTEAFVKIDSGFFNPMARVEIHYTINLIPFVSNWGISSVEQVAYAEAPISDTAEFIRNIDMVDDIFRDFLQTETGEKVAGYVKAYVKQITGALKKIFNIFK